jgi:hypothetical protein
LVVGGGDLALQGGFFLPSFGGRKAFVEHLVHERDDAVVA